MFFESEYWVESLKGLNLPGVYLGDGVLELLVSFVNEGLSLGVVLDCSFTWKPHINQVTKKVNRLMFGLWLYHRDSAQAIGWGFSLPHLDYCSVVYLDATQGLRKRLQRLSNICVRYIFALRRDACITPYRRRLGWLRIESRSRYFAAILM